MKTVIALMLALLILCMPALAAVPDISGCTDGELINLYLTIKNYIYTRALDITPDAILFDADGITLYVTGDYRIMEAAGHEALLALDCVLINNADFSCSMNIADFGNFVPTVNGWEVYASGSGSCAPGRKKKVDLRFSLSDANISTLEDVDEILFWLYSYDCDAGRIVSASRPITFTGDSFAEASAVTQSNAR